MNVGPNESKDRKKEFAMKINFRILSFLTASILMLSSYLPASAQTETFGGVTFTPPKGWTRSTKPGVVIFSDVDKAAGRFCFLTVYAATASIGNPQTDFGSNWNEAIVKPFNAPAKPETQTQTADGWTAVSGGSQVDSGGTKAVVIMTVFSGFGKSVATYAMFNDQLYIPQLDAFNATIKIDKTVAATPGTENSGVEYIADPFPDQPGYQPQQPLLGQIRKSITTADLAGHWTAGAAAVTSYFSTATGNYAGTDTVFWGESYDINPDGTFESHLTARSGNHTTRETDAGKITMSGPFITFTSKTHMQKKYQFVAYMEMPKGGAVLTMIELGMNEPAMPFERVRLNCGHAKGYITCVSGEVLSRVPAK
ncbi:MAG: hypothetical protein DMF62_08780 [Acidobacteria bacterium]|nr:MAG: hypothetical protein DMF62_08780 [Acidobacteriota bacterium]